MCTLNGGLVKLPKINTEAQLVILLERHDHEGSPWTVGKANDTAPQHLLYMFGLLLHSQVLTMIRKPQSVSMMCSSTGAGLILLSSRLNKFRNCSSSCGSWRWCTGNRCLRTSLLSGIWASFAVASSGPATSAASMGAT